MAITPTEFIWHNGSFVPWHAATTHVLAHGLHYGSAVFEGMRAYELAHDDGTAIFRLKSHIKRLFDSARIYQIEIPYSIDEIERACLDCVSMNGLRSAYIRPIAFRGFGTFSLVPQGQTPVEFAIAAIAWGAYLGNSALRDGVDVCVSSWTRLAPNTVPVLAKAAGHYLSSQLIASEAARNGYTEGIALDASGMLSEGSSENLFIVKDDVLYTTPISSSVLQGITRDSILTLADHLGIHVREQAMPREMLYVADEVFFTGTAAEITPVRSVDRTPVADGKPGPVTRVLQDAFFGLFDGKTPDRWGWLDRVPRHAPVRRHLPEPSAVPLAAAS
jgi:branched-chain amino acid aminotransferase